jgi:hypothetical protein
MNHSSLTQHSLIAQSSSFPLTREADVAQHGVGHQRVGEARRARVLVARQPQQLSARPAVGGVVGHVVSGVVGEVTSWWLAGCLGQVVRGG